MRKRSKVLSLIIMLLMLISSVSTVYAQVSDVEKHWAKEEISYMLDKGYLTGYPDGTFRPENNVSKAEFYRIINNLMGYTEKAEFGFKDVKSEDWFYNDVAKGIKMGYLIDAEFLNPRDFITREEVARIIGVTFKLSENVESTTYFKDYTLISPSAAGFIGTLKDEGYIAGFPDGNFEPLNNIKRSEVVKMLYNVLMAEGIPQKADLTAYKAALAKVKQSDYTKESWTAYQKVVLANVVTEENKQEEIDTATKAIISAQNKLVKLTSGGTVYVPTNPTQKADLTAYKAALTAVKETDYTKESWTVYQEVVLANVVTENNTQARVNEATQAIISAQKNLVKIEVPVDPVVDKTTLVAKITEVGLLSEENYTVESWEALQVVLAQAVVVNGNEKATQEEVNTAVAALTAAIVALEEKHIDPVVDKTALVETIAEAQLLNSEDYTNESWENLQVALNAAITVNANLEATQEEVDASVSALVAAIDDLVEKTVDPEVDKTALAAKIEEALSLNRGDYTEESWTNLLVAIADAIAVKENDEATQEQVDNALTALVAAIGALVKNPIEPAITNVMPNEDITISAGETLTVSFNAPEGGTAYFRIRLFIQSPMRNMDGISTNSMYEKPMNEVSSGSYSGEWIVGEGVTGTFEIEVNYVKDSDKLQDIAEGKVIIVKKPVDPEVDKTELMAVITQAQTKVEDEYTPESWAPFAESLASAIVVRDNDEATQEQVNEASLNLTTAMNGLVDKEDPVDPEVDKTELMAAITQAQTKVEDEYTPESWAPFAESLASAIVVRDNDEATQEQVNEASLNLTTAMNGLVDKEDPVDPEVDKTELMAAITQAQTKVEDEYTPESWAPFAESLASAIVVRDNDEATQEQVNEASLNLTTAMNALVEEDRPSPTIIATFHKSFMATFGNISVQVQNIERAAKFDVVYHLSDNPDGSENIKQTQIVDINQRTELIFYDSNQHNTITVRIYDMNNNLLYTFEDVLPVMGK